MRTYRCKCGNVLFFDNSLCLRCQSEVGFCPDCRNVVSLLPQPDGSYRCADPECGASLAKCVNWTQHGVCNRCVGLAGSPQPLPCDCCRFNATVPDLSIAGNLQKWARLEAAKRRLFYGLGELGLPYGTASDGINPPLAFDFKADVIPANGVWRGTTATENVYTGHADGKITINIREADDVEREKLRVEMGEIQRTLIGHFRHEIGHYYWEMLVKSRCEAECAARFGDPNHPTYAEALENHYRNGPPSDWRERYISAYASTHPWEDFAETWAAYLDLVGALDTAEHAGMGGTSGAPHGDFDEMIVRYQQLGVGLNEINRDLGLLDVVPEVMVPAVVEKMRFIHQLAQRARAENGALQPAAVAT